MTMTATDPLSTYERFARESLESVCRAFPDGRWTNGNWYIQRIGVEITWSPEKGYHYYQGMTEMQRDQVVALLDV